MTTQSMQDDPTSLILPRVRALTAYQLDPHPASVKLDQNENTLGPPGPIRAELEERVRKVPLFRYPTPGQPEIRAALATAFDWPADGILVGNGSDELLNMPPLRSWTRDASRSRRRRAFSSMAKRPGFKEPTWSRFR